MGRRAGQYMDAWEGFGEKDREGGMCTTNMHMMATATLIKEMK